MEKKIVVDGIFFTYTGPFLLKQLYDTIEDWGHDHDYQRELKRKGEEVHKDHKKYEYVAELHKKMSPVAMQVIRVRILLNNIKPVTLKRGHATKQLESGEVLITIDGFLETDMEKKWHQQAEFSFVRAIFDRFIYSFHWNRHENEIAEDSRTLLNELRDMFQRYTQ